MKTIQLNPPNSNLIVSLDSKNTRNLTPEISAIFAGSDFLRNLHHQHPEWHYEWLELWQDKQFSCDELLKKIDALNHINDETRFMKQSRLLKNQMIFFIALNDLLGKWNFQQTSDALTQMAEQLTKQCFSFTLKQMASAFNLEKDALAEHGENCGFTVIALGKLGAGELNYSSDIDLLLLYDAEKFIPNNKNRAEQIIQRFAHYFISLIETRNHDGYLFRTDLRLRPNPSSTPPAMKMETALIYYESIARNWERMVMIRANPIAGDTTLGQEFLQNILPFVWRRSLDYSTIEDIHTLQQQLISKNEDCGPPSFHGYNVKTGKGGIRSCEFYVQMLQLLWGGKYRNLRNRNMLEAIDILHQENYINDEIKNHLMIAYPYLRGLENRLQMQNDLQIQTLPKNDADMTQFAQFSGYPNKENFLQQLNHVTSECNKYYHLFLKDIIASQNSEQNNLHETSHQPNQDIHQLIKALPFHSKETISDRIEAWQAGKSRATSSERAQDLLTLLLPDILNNLAKTLNPDQAFLAFDKFLTALPAGVQLFALFKAHPTLVKIIADIMGNAPQLATMLSLNPELLEIFLEDVEIPHDTQSAIKAMQARLPVDKNYEDILSNIRIFTREQQFIIGCHMLDGHVKITQSAQYLTALAEASIHMLIDATAQNFIQQYGECGEFAVIAMGKFGSRLLLPHSDLDLVFLYRATQEYSDGKKSLFVSTYYQKFVQRLTSALTVATPSGDLYQIDLRLRPWGNDGAIANNLSTYQSYYREDAFAFEKIALSRARVIYANAPFRQEIEKTMHEILAKPPNQPQEFIHEIADMRLKVSATHSAKGLFNIKHKRGGLLELEFILQVLYLEALTKGDIPYLNDYPAIIKHLADKKYLEISEGECLTDALEFYIALQAGLRLTNLNHKKLDPLISDDNTKFDDEKSLLGRADILAQIANMQNFNDCIKKCNDLQKKITTIYHHYIGQYHKNADHIKLW